MPRWKIGVDDVMVSMGRQWRGLHLAGTGHVTVVTAVSTGDPAGHNPECWGMESSPRASLSLQPACPPPRAPKAPLSLPLDCPPRASGCPPSPSPPSFSTGCLRRTPRAAFLTKSLKAIPSISVTPPVCQEVYDRQSCWPEHVWLCRAAAQ